MRKPIETDAHAAQRNEITSKIRTSTHGGETGLHALERRLRKEATDFVARQQIIVGNGQQDEWVIRAYCGLIPETRDERVAARCTLKAKLASERRKAARNDPRYSIARHVALRNALKALESMSTRPPVGNST